MAVASEVLKHIEMGQTVDASSKLVSMQKDAAVLANEADNLAKQLEAVDKHYQEEDAELHLKIGQLGMQEETLNTKKRNSESALAGQRSVLRERESQLSSAESDLQRAEGKLRDAIKEEKKIQIGSAVGGALLARLFTGGIGWLVGAVVGVSIGAMVNASRDEEKDAHSARGRRKSDLDSAKSAVQSSESQVSSLASQINDLAAHIQRLEQQRQEIHKKGAEIRAAIPALKNSTQFWLLFKQLSEYGENRSTLLKKIVEKAYERGSYNLQCDGSQRATSTFFEAWKSIEVAAADGYSNHIYSIDSNCSSACKASGVGRGGLIGLEPPPFKRPKLSSQTQTQLESS